MTTRTAQIALPAHAEIPNCCSKFAPAPESMTKPIAKPEKTRTTSITRRTSGGAMRSKTSSWCPAVVGPELQGHNAEDNIEDAQDGNTDQALCPEKRGSTEGGLDRWQGLLR